MVLEKTTADLFKQVTGFQHAELNFYSASSLKQQSLVDMSFHLDTLF
jgi:hypothetical protein